MLQCKLETGAFRFPVQCRAGFAPRRWMKAATCSFTADRDDFLLSDGTRVARGTLVTSHYLFVEGVAVERVAARADGLVVATTAGTWLARADVTWL